jgi:hypothetical protein
MGKPSNNSLANCDVQMRTLWLKKCILEDKAKELEPKSSPSERPLTWETILNELSKELPITKLQHNRGKVNG